MATSKRARGRSRVAAQGVHRRSVRRATRILAARRRRRRSRAILGAALLATAAAGAGGAVFLTLHERGHLVPCDDPRRIDLTMYSTQVQGAVSQASAFAQGFEGSLEQVRAGSVSSADLAARGHGFRASLEEAKRALEDVSTPALAAPSKEYELAAIDLYLAAADAFAAASTADPQLLAVLAAGRVKILGDRVFDRGRALVNILSPRPSQLFLTDPIPDFAALDLDPVASATAPVPEAQASSTAFAAAVDAQRRVLQRSLRPGALEKSQAALAQSVDALARHPSSACATEASRGLRLAAAVAVEAARVASPGRESRTAVLSGSLATVSTRIWNVAARQLGADRL